MSLRGRHQSRGQTEEAVSHLCGYDAAAQRVGALVIAPLGQTATAGGWLKGMHSVNGGRGTDGIDGALPRTSSIASHI